VKKVKSEIRPTGTREWAEESYNIGQGCQHGCLYCYARCNALRFKLISKSGEWEKEHIIQKKVDKKWSKCNGTIMYPTAHDITPYYLKDSIIVLKKMLEAGNKVLIVSKPHLECIKVMCEELSQYKQNILFRFTIGSGCNQDLKFWEPNAPSFEERRESLKHAFSSGFQTSVSSEPMLAGIEDAMYLYGVLREYITDCIWFGKMNKIDQRIEHNDITNPWIERIKYYQDNDNIRVLYDFLKDDPKVKWKDSIKQVVGIVMPDKIGMDV